MIPITSVNSLEDAQNADAWIVVGPSIDALPNALSEKLSAPLTTLSAIDESAWQEVGFIAEPEAAGGRLILAPTGALDNYYNDVRSFGDAARAGIARALKAGAERPLLVVFGVPESPAYRNGILVAARDAIGAGWIPYENVCAGESSKLQALFVLCDDRTAQLAAALGNAHNISRDVCAAEPEKVMTPQGMAKYATAVFKESEVSVSVIAERAVIEKDYPLLAAVARASYAVERHHPRIIRLEYGDQNANAQYFFAGKGLTYDTGGADLKAGGHMAGMSRDKGGAAGVIGIFAAAAALKPKNVRLVAEIGAVRNSVGEESYVSDEIITGHAGLRVRIGNTDAEGRLVLADLLSHLRDEAPKNATLFSVATLTGHSGLAAAPYGLVLGNGVAVESGLVARIGKMGDLIGDCFEISRIRREDHAFIKPKSEAEDMISCNNLPSSQTKRGHQFPTAFLEQASGLHRHGAQRSSATSTAAQMSSATSTSAQREKPLGEKPLGFVHMDIGGSAFEGGDWLHGRPTGTPVSAVASALNFFE